MQTSFNTKTNSPGTVPSPTDVAFLAALSRTSARQAVAAAMTAETLGAEAGPAA